MGPNTWQFPQCLESMNDGMTIIVMVEIKMEITMNIKNEEKTRSVQKYFQTEQ